MSRLQPAMAASSNVAVEGYLTKRFFGNAITFLTCYLACGGLG
jgi:hypothetical protein